MNVFALNYTVLSAMSNVNGFDVYGIIPTFQFRIMRYRNLGPALIARFIWDRYCNVHAEYMRQFY